MMLTATLSITPAAIAAPSPAATQATRFVAPPAVAAEIRAAVDAARVRFEARDAAGVLKNVSEQYRSAGWTKTAVRQQLLTMFGLYEELRARVRVDRVEIADGRTEVFTTGDVSGRLPWVGWVTVLKWDVEPEVVRREDGGWRLFGFQD